MKNSVIRKKSVLLQSTVDVLKELYESSTHRVGKRVFCSDSFQRTVLDKDFSSGHLKIIKDFFPKKGIGLYCVSFSAHAAEHIQFSLEAESIRQIGNSGKLVTFIQKQDRCFFIPILPVVRCWNKKNHIVYERSDYYIQHEDHSLIFEVDFSENESLDLIVLSISSEQLDDLSNIHKHFKKEYTLTGPWVVISPLLDCWRFMVDGKIYEYREGTSREASARFSSQQAALFLYKLVSMQQDYVKDLVEVIKDEIAYSVMLDLEPDGRWVHGCWTDDMETHTRFQVDGIHLLLDHFQETRSPIFLEKALLATNYLLSLTDVLKDESLWFLHDTLELGNNYIYPVIKSKAFGKSETNVLCLNTHLSALCALIRLHNETKKEELKAAIDNGLKAAEMVLKAEPAINLYRMIYYFVDLSFDRTYGVSKRFPSLKDALKIVLGLGASGLLPYIKKAFPRIIMPNGFTTRHLSLSHESYHYHIINVYDILVLYQLLILNGYKGLGWLWNIIDKAIDYCLKGYLVGYLIRNEDKFVPQLIEAIIMYAAFNNEFDKKKLVDFTLTLKDNGYKLPSGSYGLDNLVTPKEYQVSGLDLSTYSSDIESFNISPRDKNFKELLVINTGSKEEEIDIVLKSNPKRLEVISSGGDEVEAPRLLGSRDYLLVRLYDAGVSDRVN